MHIFVNTLSHVNTLSDQEQKTTSIARQDHVLDQRIDLRLPAPAAENAVVADAELQVMALEMRAQTRAHLVSSHRLAHSTDVVALALDREQHGTANRAWLDLVAVPCERSARQRMLLKHQTYGLQIELRAEVQHGKIFVVELLGGLRLLGLAVDQILIELAMCLQVAIDVH